jgi:hypothetical protein
MTKVKLRKVGDKVKEKIIKFEEELKHGSNNNKRATKQTS